VKADSTPYYVPQIFGQYNHLTIAQELRVDDKLIALREILDGNVTERNLAQLNDDWTLEERCQQALHYWQLQGLELGEKIERLSGGQKTKVFLSGISIHQPQFVLLDEPSNHLDVSGRSLLYDFIQSDPSTLLIVSHDRHLLNLLDETWELSRGEIATYGGNYDFYVEQKSIEKLALHEDVKSKEKALRKAKVVERETAERQQKLDARGKKKQEKAGVATIMMNTMRNNAEKSTSKAKAVHAEKVGTIAQELDDLRKELPDTDTMKFGFDHSKFHRGKILIKATNINYSYGADELWKQLLSFEIRSRERIALKGSNGSGKTTLIKLVLGEINPTTGTIYKAENKSVYIDQDYSLIHNGLKVYEQAEQFNDSGLQEHEIKIRLSRFLFAKNDWDKQCNDLSGGERMRLILCCLTVSLHAPDIIILDEPTNNLDTQNIEILTAAVNGYHGTLIVVSHDKEFVDEIKLERTIDL